MEGKPSNSLVTKRESFSSYVSGAIGKSLIANVLSDPKDQARFAQQIITLVAMNQGLRECDYATVVSAALQAIDLKLPLNNQLGFAYVVPYNDKRKGKIAQFQIGYKGLEQLAYRSGKVARIGASAIKEGEMEVYDPIFGRYSFKALPPEKRESAKTIGYVAYFFLSSSNGESPSQIAFSSVEEIKAFATKYSQAYRSGANCPWTTAFDQMAEKTLLKRVLKHSPCAIDEDFQKAIVADQAVIRGTGDSVVIEYPDGTDGESIDEDAKTDNAPKNDLNASPSDFVDSDVKSATKEQTEAMRSAFGALPVGVQVERMDWVEKTFGKPLNEITDPSEVSTLTSLFLKLADSK